MKILSWLTVVIVLASTLAIGCGDDADAANGDAGDRDASVGDGDGDGDGDLDAGDGDGGDHRDSGLPVGAQEGLLITLADGRLEGIEDGDARAFLGIPFAKPPVGELRWKAPEDVEPWAGNYPATSQPSACAQLTSIQNSAGSESEDCLYLNVWAPADAPSEPLPVMFWIHGGGNTVGSIADEVPLLTTGDLFYNGRTFAERYGVVVVTANYRLGALGFFPHPDLADEDSPLGNQGLLDQRKALEWVRDNITAFGGDPDNVTIFGESAGSFNTCFHVASPGSRGLFHRAISQSGGCTTNIDTAAETADQMAAMTEAMGCGDAEDKLACLRDVDAADLIAEAPILNAPAEELPGGAQYQGGTPAWRFRPVVDGDVLPDSPRELFAAGDVAQVPYILGSNTDEGTLFHLGAMPVADEEQYLEALERRFGDAAADIAALYPPSDFASADAALQRVSGDSGLVCGTYDTAVRAAEAGLDVYMYNFDLPLTVAGYEFLGAVHGAEIAYVFQSAQSEDPAAMVVAELMSAYWAEFATTGDPNHDGALEWPAFDAANDTRMNFAADSSVVEDFRADECAFWRAAYDAADSM